MSIQKGGVKKILNKRLTSQGQVEYLVQFKGQQDPQWEPIIHLKKELDMLADFEVEYELRLKKENQQEQNNSKANTEDEEYEIEQILEKRQNHEGTQYKVKWKGYPISESTWEPEANLSNAVIALEKFKEQEKKNKKIQMIEEKEKKLEKTEYGHFYTDIPDKVIGAQVLNGYLFMIKIFQIRQNNANYSLERKKKWNTSQKFNILKQINIQIESSFSC